MPDTLTGLLIFIVVLLPGFAYLARKERREPARRPTALREAISVVAASVTSLLAVLAVFTVLRIVLPGDATPDVGELVDDPGAYISAEDNHRRVLGWGIGLLLAAVALARAATMDRVRNWQHVQRFTRSHPIDQSRWWQLFKVWPAKHALDRRETRPSVARATCYLTDGSIIEGDVSSFNRLTEETPDRDLILLEPLAYETVEGKLEHPPAQAVCVSARDIRLLFVTYSPPEPDSPERSASAAERDDDEAPLPVAEPASA